MTESKKIFILVTFLFTTLLVSGVKANEPLFSASEAITIGTNYLKEKNINFKGNSYLSLIQYKPDFLKPEKSYWFLKWKSINPLVKGGWFGLHINNQKMASLIYGK